MGGYFFSAVGSRPSWNRHIKNQRENLGYLGERKIDKHKSVRYNVRKGGATMTNTNITNFRKNIYGMLEQTIKYNEPVNVSTKDGNAVILSEEDYNGLMETLYLSSVPQLKEDIIKGMSEPLSDSVPEGEVDW